MQPELKDEDEPAWRRRLGSRANNRAWALAEQAKRSEEEDLEMLNAAHASMHLWSTIGTARNVALAQLLLGHVHALLGNTKYATNLAEAAYEHLVSNGPEQWSLALANAVRANAAHVAGNFQLHEQAYRAAEAACMSITNAEERQIVLATINVVPQPIAGSPSAA